MLRTTTTSTCGTAICYRRLPPIGAEGNAARQMLKARFQIDHVTLQPSWPLQPAFGEHRVIPIVPADGA